MNILLVIAIAMTAGLVVSRAARAVKLPNVTAFLLAGLVIGPCVTGIVNREQLASMSVISEAALGFIAYAIGITTLASPASASDAKSSLLTGVIILLSTHPA